MSTVIDNEIVSMQFDNKDFEKNAKTSLNTIDKLKEKLRFKDATEGFNNINRAASNVDFSNIAASISSLESHFSTMGIVGMTVISNLTSSVMRLGSNITNTLFSMIKTGGIARAMKIEQAKFQLAGLGVEWEKIKEDVEYGVNDTAYGLDAAANVASQLSASGVEIGDNMKAALRGISGVAGMTNSTYEEIGSIYTTIAGQGKVMTQQLRMLEGRGLNAAAQLGKALGKSEADIRQMVTDGKINFEMFSKAMNEAFGDHAKEANNTLTGVTANIRSALSKIGADFVQPLIENQGPIVKFLESIRAKLNEFRKQLGPLVSFVTTKATGVFESLADAINGINISFKFQGQTYSGITERLKNLVSEFDHFLNVAKNIVGPIGDAFMNVFGKMFRVSSMGSFTNTFSKLISFLAPTAKQMKEIERAFTGFFSLFDIGFKIIKAIITPILKLSGAVDEVGSSLLTGAAGLGDWITELDEALTSSGAFEKIQENVSKIVGNIGEAIGSIATQFGDWTKRFDGIAGFFSAIGSSISTAVYYILKSISDITGIDIPYDVIASGIFSISESISSFVENISSKGTNVIFAFIDAIKALASGIDIDWSPLQEMMSKIREAVNPLEIITEVLNVFIHGVVTLLTNAWPIISSIGGAIINGIKNLVKGLTDSLTNGDANALNMSVFAVVLYQIKNILIQFKKITNNFSFTKTLNDFLTSITNTLNETQRNLKAGYFLKIAGSVLILAIALEKLSNLDTESLAKAGTAITVLMGELLGMSEALTKITSAEGFNPKNVQSLSKTFVPLAVALLIMSKTVEMLANLDTAQAIQGVIGLGIIMVELQQFMKHTQNMEAVKTGGLISLSIAILIMTQTVKQLGALPIAQAIQGVIGLGIIMVELQQFMKHTQNMAAAKTGGLIALSISILIITQAVKQLGSIDTGMLVKGELAVGALMIIMGVFSKIASGSKNMMSVGVGMIAVAAAMLIMAKAVNAFGSMDPNTLATGLESVGISLFGLVIVMQLLQNVNCVQIGVGMLLVGIGLMAISNAVSTIGSMNPEQVITGLLGLGGALLILGISVKAMNGCLAGAAAILVISAALLMLVPALLMLSSMSIEQIFTMVISLAAAFTVLGVAAVVLAPISPVILALSVALLALGVAVGLAGVGILAISAGISLLISALKEFMAIGPAATDGMSGLMKALAIAVINSISPIVDAFVAIGKGILDTINRLMPHIMMTLMNFITNLNVLIPAIMTFLRMIFTQIVITIRLFVPMLVDTALFLITSLLESIAEYVPRMIEAGTEIIKALIIGIKDAQLTIINVAFETMISFINGLADAINTHTPELINAVKNLFNALVNAAILILEEAKSSGKEVVLDILKTIISEMKIKTKEMINIIKNTISKMIQKIKDSVTNFKNLGGDIVTGIVNGIKDKIKNVIEAGKSIGTSVLQAAKKAVDSNSPSKEFIKLGHYIGDGLIIGIRNMTGGVALASYAMGESTVKSARDALDMINEALNIDEDMTITPVLDLTNIKNGADRINSMLETNPSIAYSTASSFEALQNKLSNKLSNDDLNNEKAQSTSYNFTQNNYSPKSLSRLDIYRQTNAQLKAMKGLVSQT